MQRIIALLISTVVAAPALAAEVSASKTHRSWTTSTHLGFAVVQQSTTGFDDVAGSLVFLDLTHPLPFGNGRIELGLRTLAEGGQTQEGEFYRMGAGPMAGYRVSDRWTLHVSGQGFRETGLNADGDKVYSSTGRTLMIGWERHHQIHARVDLAWGGFISQYSGGVEAMAAAVGTQTPNKNQGLTHGVEIALRMRL
jgi:hypothetical protein